MPSESPGRARPDASSCCAPAEVHVRAQTAGVEDGLRKLRHELPYSRGTAEQTRQLAPAVDQLVGTPVQTRGLTMRCGRRHPRRWPRRRGTTIVVAIELARETDAVEAAKDRASTSSRSTQTARSARASDMPTVTTATGIDCVPGGRGSTHPRLAWRRGQYQVADVAAVGANKTQGSVFTEVTVPKFDSELALGGLSLVSPTPGAAVNAKQMSEVVALTPYAARDVPPNTAMAAEVRSALRRKPDRRR